MTLTTYLSEKRPEPIAFDTETCNGQVILLCSSGRQESALYNADLSPIKSEEMIRFLFSKIRPNHEEVKVGFVFNTVFEFGGMVKSRFTEMSPDDIDEFLEHKEVWIGDYLISYTPNKGYHISKGKNKVSVYDIGNILKEGRGETLDELAKQYLKKQKVEGIDRQRLGTSLDYWREIGVDKIVEYCRRDAQITRELASWAVDFIHDSINLYPRFWYSKASIAKAWMELNHGDQRNLWFRRKTDWEDEFNHSLGKKLTRECILPAELQLIVEKSYYGGLFHQEVFGKIPNLCQIDVRSMYPSVLARLPNFANLNYDEVDRVHKDAVYGFYEVKMRYDTSCLVPMRYNSGLIYPTSDFEDTIYVSKPELDYYISRGLHPQVLRGVEWFGDDLTPAFADMNEIYKKKESAENRHLKFLLKIIMNSGYGVLAQQQHGITDFTNLVYAAYITAESRVQMRTQFWDRIPSEHRIALYTDAVLFEDPNSTILPKLRGSIGNEMGQAAVKCEQALGIFYGLGVYRITKGSEEIEFKKRGYEVMSRDEFLSMRGSRHSFKLHKPTRVIQALIQGRAHEINVWEDIDRTMDLFSLIFTKRQVKASPTFEFMRENRLSTSPHHLQINEAGKVDILV